MTVPSESDIKKRKTNRGKLAKKITEDGHLKEQELVRLFRKAVDSAWMTAAHKLVFLEDRVIPDLDPNTRTKWLIKCNICGGLFKLNEVNVDHIIGEFACTKREEFLDYFLSRMDVGFDDLQILCIDNPKKGHTGCHQIKTLQERSGLTWEEAVIEKKVIAICKAKEDKIWLLERGIKPDKNGLERRGQIIKALMEEKENDL